MQFLQYFCLNTAVHIMMQWSRMSSVISVCVREKIKIKDDGGISLGLKKFPGVCFLLVLDSPPRCLKVLFLRLLIDPS